MTSAVVTRRPRPILAFSLRLANPPRIRQASDVAAGQFRVFVRFRAFVCVFIRPPVLMAQIVSEQNSSLP